MVAASLAVAGPAAAGYQYPSVPQDGSGPGAPRTTKRKQHRNLRVCKRGCRYRKIQAAVDGAKAGDTIQIAPGRYRGGIDIEGHGKDGLRIIGMGRSRKRAPKGAGAPASARKVILDGAGVKGGPGDNGVFAIDVDRLVVRNLTVENFDSNGVFVLGHQRPCDGYVLDKLYARNNTPYGLYALNCKGGRITRSTATLSGDGGVYIGGTPPQAKPKPTLVEKLVANKNALGFSGTNMKYVTIRKSDFYNNSIGILTSAFNSEPHIPNSNNVIEQNRVFWNNIDVYARGSKKPPYNPAPFWGAQRAHGESFVIGSGIVLLGGRDNVVQGNDVFGNYLWGVALVEDVVLDPSGSAPQGNKVTGNRFGRGGVDPNGVSDLFFEARTPTSGNCWSNSPQTTDPIAGGSYPACPFSGANPFSQSQLDRAKQIGFGNPSSFWARKRHPDLKPFKPFPSNPQ